MAEIQPGGPADRAGLKRGDVIVKLGDRDVSDPSAMRNMTASLDVGSKVDVTFYREGERQSLPVTIDELPPAPEVVASFGFRVRAAAGGPSDAAALEIDQVVTGSPAFRAGLRPGMRILAVGPEAVATPAQFEAVIRKVDLRLGLPLKLQLNDGRFVTVLVGGPSAKDQP